MQFLIVVVFVGVLFFTDFLPVIKSGSRKEMWTYGAVFAIGCTVMMLHIFNVQLPMFPTTPITNAVQWITGG